jgi:hypothetical protein
MSEVNPKAKVRILQDDCEGYGLYETKNGATIEIDSDLAARMVQSGHAVIETAEAKPTPAKK